MKHIIYSFLFVFIFPIFIAGCDEEMDMGMNYAEVLESSFNAEGEGKAVPLTIEKATGLDGTITNNGKYFVYASDKERGNFDIYLRSLNDITTVRITAHPTKDHSPAISPNGKIIAFVSQRDDPQGDIYVLELNPKDVIEEAKELKENMPSLDGPTVNITRVSDEKTKVVQVIKDANPSWSPDSKLIVYSTTYMSGIENIWTCKPNKKNKKQITTDGGIQPKFSNDGTKIVYISYKDDPNGDVYIYDIPTASISRITNDTNIQMYPSFGAANNVLYYTQIDEDTNNDGKIDLEDNSVLVSKSIENGMTYALTYHSISSFGSKWFPAYPLKYKDTEEINYNGVIVYSEQKGNSININIIPEYGVIPKRQSASKQYKIAEKFYYDGSDLEKVIYAYQRVYNFFGFNKDDESVIYTTRSLKELAVIALKDKQKTTAQIYLKNLESMKDSEDANTYRNITIAYLTEEISGKNGIALYEKSLENLKKSDNEYSKKIMPFLIEDIGDHYTRYNNPKKAEEYYSMISSFFSDYERTQKVKLSLGDIKYDNNKNIPAEYYDLIISGSDHQKDNVVKSIIRNYKSERKTAVRITKLDNDINVVKSLPPVNETVIKSKQKILEILFFLQADAYYEKNDIPTAKNIVQTHFANFNSEEFLYYKFSKLSADIYMKEKDESNEEINLYNAANSYMPKWDQSDYSEVVKRLISIYEKNGEKLIVSKKFNDAMDIYEKYAKFISTVGTKGVSKEVYAEFGLRAHVLYIDTYYLKHKRNFASLEKIEEWYLADLKKARKSYDSAFICGLAYIYAKQAYHLDRHYIDKGNFLNIRKGVDIGKTRYSVESIPQLFRLSVDNLNWALFINEGMVDAYLMKGWIYQYLDSRRLKDASSDGDLAAEIDNYFPKYLLEENVINYQRALNENNEMKNPEAEGNVHLNLANTYFVLYNYPKALTNYIAAKKYKTSFENDKQELLFYYHLAYCYYQTGENEKAMQDLGRLENMLKSQLTSGNKKQVSRKLITIYRFYALFSRVDEKYKDAIDWYSKIIQTASKSKIDIDSARYYQEIANCYYEMDDYDNAMIFIAKSDKLLKKMDIEDEESKFYLEMGMFGLGPFKVYNMGPDSAAFGNARVFTELDVLTKTIMNLSLKESIYEAKGDYKKVIDCLDKKIELADERNYSLYQQVKSISLNNKGHAYYMLGNYKESDKFIQSAWDYSMENNDLDGVFRSIKNKATLYAYLIENYPSYFKDPIKSLNKLIGEIDAYKKDYEKEKYAVDYETMKEDFKKLEKKITPEDRNMLREKIKADAQGVYYELDISSSILNFYKAEYLVMNLENNGVEIDSPYNLFKYYKDIYNLYADSVTIFERSLKNEIPGIGIRTKVLLLLNAATCRERLGQYQEAYALFGNAETLVKQYSFIDIDPILLLKVANFINRNYKSLKIDREVALSYYEKAVELIEDVPFTYYDKMSKISKIYDNYSVNLTENGKLKKSAEIREKGRSMHRVLSIYNASPEFFNDKDRGVFDSLTMLVNNYRIDLRKISTLKEKGITEEDSKMKSTRERIAVLKKQIKDLKTTNTSFNSYISLEKTSLPVVKDSIFDIFIKDGYCNIWILKNGEVKFEREQYQGNFDTFVNNVFQKYGTQGKRFVILNKSVFNSTDLQLGGNVFIYSYNDVFAVKEDTSAIKNGIVLKTPINKYAAKTKKSLLLYSSICDNESTIPDLSVMLFKGSIKPSIIVKRIKPDTINDAMLLYHASRYNGVDSLILYISETPIPTAENLPQFAGISSFEDMNSLKKMPSNYAAVGLTGSINTGAIINDKALSELMVSFTENFNKGNYTNAVYYLYRWKEFSAQTPDNTALYNLKMASVNMRAGEPLEAYNLINSIKISEITDQKIVSEIISSKIYILLSIGNINEAHSKLNNSVEGGVIGQTDDHQIYSAVINGIKNGNINDDIVLADNSILDRTILLVMMNKYVYLINGKESSIKFSAKHFNKFNGSDIDRISLVMLSGNKTESPLTTARAEKIDKLYKSQPETITNLYGYSLFNKGVYDSYSIYAVDAMMTVLKKNYKSKEIASNLKAIDINTIALTGFFPDIV